MNAQPNNLNFDFPDLTAANMGWILNRKPQSIRKTLRHYPATGQTVVSGSPAETWHQTALPSDLRLALAKATRAGGFETVGEKLRAGAGQWQPAVPLAQCSDECLAEAKKAMQGLVPFLNRSSLVASRAELVRDGLADFKRATGQTISEGYFYRLVARTRARDGGLGRYERLELYLPERPERRDALTPALAVQPFSKILSAIKECGPMETLAGDRIAQVSREDNIWQTTFETRKALLAAGEDRKALDRRLYEFLSQYCPWLAANRKLLRQAFARRLARWVAGKPADGRQANGGDESDLTKQIKALPWFFKAARFFYLISNRTEDSGSMPEAVRRVILLPHTPAGWPPGAVNKFLKAIGIPKGPVPSFPAELRERILQRQKNYQDLVPETIARQVRVNPSVVKFYRNPRDWELANQCAPGSQRRFFNEATGERQIMAPGDWFGGDDSTPGIAVCVPVQGIQTPLSEKYGVMLGRFQWLAYHDGRTDKILAWDYVLRPRGSYRAEDILCGMKAVVSTHGIPRHGWQFEGGTFNAKLVRQAIAMQGCEHWRTYSPHQKAIESVFNRVWTRLAVNFPHADMGRFRNENADNCKLYEACKRGEKNPRQYFPAIEDVMAAFVEVVAEHNAKPIDSKQYGRWIPDEFFDGEIIKSPLRKFSPDMEWMFSPFTAERKVHGMLIRCQVPMFEGYSVPFEFGADWLPRYNGMQVRIHFDPHMPKCVAKVVLLQNANGHKAGDVLGDARLISETAQNIRYILGLSGDDQAAGFEVRQKTANLVRRETRGIGTGGRVEYSHSVHRDGLGTVGIIQRDGAAAAPAVAESTASGDRLASAIAEPKEDHAAARDRRHAELEKLREETDSLLL